MRESRVIWRSGACQLSTPHGTNAEMVEIPVAVRIDFAWSSVYLGVSLIEQLQQESMTLSTFSVSTRALDESSSSCTPDSRSHHH